MPGRTKGDMAAGSVKRATCVEVGLSRRPAAHGTAPPSFRSR